MDIHKRVVVAIVDWASRYPLYVLFGTLTLLAGLVGYASRLDIRSDLLELLPRDSPGFRALEHQMGRVGGGSTLIVIVQSPSRVKNEQFIDDLAARIATLPRAHDLIAYVEAGTKDVRAFFESNKWLYADLDELQKADDDLDHAIAIRSGLVEDLSAPAPAPAHARATGPPAPGGALGLAPHLRRWEDRAARDDAFPTGYFETKDGKLVGLRVISMVRLGDGRGDELLADIRRVTEELAPQTYHPDMVVGFTGDIASAAGEKEALLNQAVWATALALVVIVIALILYYRSIWAPFIIALPALFGIGAAYAFAEWVFGYVNTSGAFLGAIILGNGINYPIVLLSRYYEFRARKMAPDVARREAVLNAFRAELVGACVAAIAYGSLSLTRFRGFSQFGAIGFVGMLFVWASIVPLVPAMVVLVERIQPNLPRFLRDREHRLRTDGSRSWLTRLAALSTARYPWHFIAIGVAVTVLAGIRIPGYFADPWEYDFGKLGSKKSDVSGAGEWSDKANEVFGGKMNIAGAMMLADDPDQVPLVKAQMLANDAKDPQGKLLAEIATIDDLLPGTAAEQKAKLDVLESIRSRLTPRVLASLDDADRKTVADAKPPEKLHALAPKDLPPLLRRRFTENDGRIGTVFYVKPRNDIIMADAHNHLRLSKTTDNVQLADGRVVMTASRSTIFAEMLTSMRRDGPLASLIAFVAVMIVVALAARNARIVLSVLLALVTGVTWLAGATAFFKVRINYVNFIAFPITLGIGSEYPFNIADRTRILGGNVAQAISRSAGAVLLCSFTTVVGYGSLMLSDFQALESFGELAVIGELACVFAAVFFMPSVLTVLGTARVGRVPLTADKEHTGNSPHIPQS